MWKEYGQIDCLLSLSLTAHLLYNQFEMKCEMLKSLIWNKLSALGWWRCAGVSPIDDGLIPPAMQSSDDNCRIFHFLFLFFAWSPHFFSSTRIKSTSLVSPLVSEHTIIAAALWYLDKPNSQREANHHIDIQLMTTLFTITFNDIDK